MDTMHHRCQQCRHYHAVAPDTWCCKAFPEGIPNEVRSGEICHDVPYHGDNGYRFERLTEAEGDARRARWQAEPVGSG